MTWDRGAGVLPTTYQRMSADEYFELPVGPPHFQLIDGELFMSPSPNFFHQELIGNLASSIREYLRTNRIGKVIMAPSDVQFDLGNVYQPDIYFIRNERLQIVDKQGPKGAPDLVVEVISGSTGRLDLGPKKMVYEAAGVTEFWAVFPEQERVDVYRFAEKAGEPLAVLRGDDALETALLPGWKMALVTLFER